MRVIENKFRPINQVLTQAYRMNSALEPQLNTSDNSQTVHNVMQRQATSMPNGKHDFFY